MPKKPPSYYKNGNVKKVRTTRDWINISIYLFLALALIISTFAAFFAYSGGGHSF
ncbi:MAG: hypothetical protein AAF633_00290 [Chloroflexota bacterium]